MIFFNIIKNKGKVFLVKTLPLFKLSDIEKDICKITSYTILFLIILLFYLKIYVISFSKQ